MEREERAYSLLKEIGFERTGGSEEETKAAAIISEHLEKEGIACETVEFDVQMSHIQKAYLEVTEPYHKIIECTAYMCCENTPEEGIEKELLYYEMAENEVLNRQAKDKILLMNGFVGTTMFKKIAKLGMAGFITFNGEIDNRDNFDLDRKEFRKPLQHYGNVPCVNIKVEEAMELVERKASKVRMVTLQQPYTGHSRNVVAEIEGSENRERIVFTAHYDSVPFSKGFYDNGTGTVTLYELALYFKKHQPKHHLTFVFCGSEERGLLGSHAYCDAHEDMNDIALCINVDMVGSTMGNRIAVATAEKSLVDFIDYFGKIKGFPIKCSQGVYSSDSTPFADRGIPAVSFARITSKGTGTIHCRHDVLEHLNSAILKEDIDFICDFACEMANSCVIPVPRTMPQNMKDELDKYLARDKEENK